MKRWILPPRFSARTPWGSMVSISPPSQARESPTHRVDSQHSTGTTQFSRVSQRQRPAQLDARVANGRFRGDAPTECSGQPGAVRIEDLQKHQRRSDTIKKTFRNPFVEGLATLGFEPALRLPSFEVIVGIGRRVSSGPPSDPPHNHHHHFDTCLPRKSRINEAISAPWVSSAKCPASSRWNSRVLRSRL